MAPPGTENSDGRVAYQSPRRPGAPGRRVAQASPEAPERGEPLAARAAAAAALPLGDPIIAAHVEDVEDAVLAQPRQWAVCAGLGEQ